MPRRTSSRERGRGFLREVGTLEDLRALAGLGLAGIIVGRALYEGRFTVEEALRCLAPV